MAMINRSMNSYDDKWILDNWKNYRYVSEMYADYISEHTDYHTLSGFKQRTAKLGLTRRYTKEQDEWLKVNYPNLGAKEAYDRFCKRFGVKKGFEGFKSRIKELGLKVSEERQHEADQNNGDHEGVPVGTITRRCRNTEWIKAEDGWKPLQREVVGEIPKGYRVIHLDRNGRNNNIDNLEVVSPKVCAMLTGNGFWSNNREVTRTGVMSCRLQELLEITTQK